MSGKIAIAPLEGRVGFEIRQALINRLGSARSPEYLLTVVPRISRQGQAIRSDNTTTRVQVAGRARFTLVPFDSSDVVLTDEVRNFTAYSTTASPFATDIASQGADRRLAVALAEQIAQRLAASAEEWLR